MPGLVPVTLKPRFSSASRWEAWIWLRTGSRQEDGQLVLLSPSAFQWLGKRRF